ncbi:MAG: sugar phosphate isomerase/epimerase [Phycisphaerales bacterium]|nr:sugar phosphate isomerase/epimerase [Phycisphaerales bacterium]
MQIGVCSWSLRPNGPADLAQRVRACGLDAVQLALDPLRTGDWDERLTVAVLRDAGIDLRSGMMATRGEDYSTLDSIRRTGGLRPGEHWEENLAAAAEDAALARRLGINLVTFHAGFLPHGAGAERRTMIERLRRIADVLARHGVRVGLETGQETADTLVGVLREVDHPGVGVNFDPGNMILYGMGDPVDALRALAPWVRQVHVKDAVPAATPGRWGTEVRAGTGAVDWPAFFALLGERCPGVDLFIEREACMGTTADIIAAAELIRATPRAGRPASPGRAPGTRAG